MQSTRMKIVLPNITEYGGCLKWGYPPNHPNRTMTSFNESNLVTWVPWMIINFLGEDGATNGGATAFLDRPILCC